MFCVTDSAQQKVAEHFEGKEVSPIRVFLHHGGCAGSQLAMALDEKKDTDDVFVFSGIEYLVDSEFLKEARPIQVDYIETGFKVTSSLKLGGGCSSCGDGGSCGV